MKTTTWSEATKDKLIAVENIISCHRSGHRPIVTKRNNKDLTDFEYPIKIKNPALDDWRNWTMSYAVPSSADVYSQILNIKNETEKDLAYNYTSYFFSSEKERAAYFKKGKLPKKFSNSGFCGPMKKSDYFKMRPDLVKAGWTDRHIWTTFWQPIKGVSYWIAEDCGEVYCVTFDNSPAMSETEFNNFLAQFLTNC